MKTLKYAFAYAVLFTGFLYAHPVDIQAKTKPPSTNSTSSSTSTTTSNPVTAVPTVPTTTCIPVIPINPEDPPKSKADFMIGNHACQLFTYNDAKGHDFVRSFLDTLNTTNQPVNLTCRKQILRTSHLSVPPPFLSTQTGRAFRMLICSVPCNSSFVPPHIAQIYDNTSHQYPLDQLKVLPRTSILLHMLTWSSLVSLVVTVIEMLPIQDAFSTHPENHIKPTHWGQYVATGTVFGIGTSVMSAVTAWKSFVSDKETKEISDSQLHSSLQATAYLACGLTAVAFLPAAHLLVTSLALHSCDYPNSKFDDERYLKIVAAFQALFWLGGGIAASVARASWPESINNSNINTVLSTSLLSIVPAAVSWLSYWFWYKKSQT